MFKLFCIYLTLITLALIKADPLCAGCENPLTSEEAEPYLQSVLDAAKANGKPAFSILRIKKAGVRVVAGSIYNIEADLINPNQFTNACSVKIHAQPWLNDGIEATVDCYGTDAFTFKYTQSGFPKQS